MKNHKWYFNSSKLTFSLLLICLAVFCFLVFPGKVSGSIITFFGPENLVGGYEITATAVAEVSIFEQRPTGGVIDFAFTNTSPLHEVEPGVFASAFVTEFQFNLPAGYTPLFADPQTKVIAAVGVRFSDGAGQPVVATAVERLLDWSYGPSTGGGLVARVYEATNKANKNAIFSSNALSPTGVPQEDIASGFIKTKWDGAVFDTVIFRVAFEDTVPITEDDLNFYQEGNLTAKYQGGNGSGWGTKCSRTFYVPSFWNWHAVFNPVYKKEKV